MRRRLRWTRRRKARTPVTGLLLSGGGAGAGFQVGALRYLCDRVNMSPSVITGTSPAPSWASCWSKVTAARSWWEQHPWPIEE
jgi:hypothetical protein